MQKNILYNPLFLHLTLKHAKYPTFLTNQWRRGGNFGSYIGIRTAGVSYKINVLKKGPFELISHCARDAQFFDVLKRQTSHYYFQYVIKTTARNKYMAKISDDSLYSTETNTKSIDAQTLADAMSFLLAASLIAFCTFFSSLWISANNYSNQITTLLRV